MNILLKFLIVVELMHLSSGECNSYNVYKNAIPIRQCPERNRNEKPFWRREMCSSWCRNTAPGNAWVEVTNSSLGRVRVSMDFPPGNCNHTKFEVTLLLDKAGSCTQRLHHRHSTKEVIVTSSASNNCSKILELDFEYVFTGCYQLEFQPFINLNSQQKCFSKIFHVETEYTKDVINAPYFYITKENSRIKLDFASVFVSGHVPEMVNVDLNSGVIWESNDTCLDSGVTEACCYVDNYSQDYQEINSKNLCNCKWYKGEILECSFRDIPPGSYCIQVEADDIRCAEGTFWTYEQQCIWHYQYNFSRISLGSNSTQVNLGSSEIPWLYPLIFCVLFPFCLVLILLVKKYMEKIKGVYRPVQRSPIPIKKQGQQSLEKKYILLLYPRDCEIFMHLMATFRKMLQCITNFVVEDIWDEERFDEIAAVGERWGLGKLSDRKTKVLVVATPCSRRVEQALLSGQTVSYIQPKFFDNIFPVTLSHLFTIKDTYNRVYPVRLDDEDFNQNVFCYISTGTVFTLPHQFNSLISAFFGCIPMTTVVNFQSNDEVLQDLMRLFNLQLNMYREYKQKHTDYLDNLLIVN